MAIRVYLAGTLALESEAGVIDRARFGARQSRLLFAYLVLADGRPVAKAELADVLWPDGAPSSWEVSLAALVSKLRALLAAPIGREALDGALGAYRLALPAGSWVDVVAVGAERYRAEGALLRGALAEANAHALIASAIAHRTFLPEDVGPWVESVRAQLTEQRAQCLEILANTLLGMGDLARSVHTASELLESDPFRETAYQLLMRAHAAAGNRADALRVYERCRRLLSDELGVDPSPATEAVYLDILRA